MKRRELARLWRNVKASVFIELGTRTADFASFVDFDFSRRLTKSNMLHLRADLICFNSCVGGNAFVDIMLSKLNRWIRGSEV